MSEHTGYGAAGNEGFRFYDPRMAEGITITGQYFIRAVADAIDDYLSKITKSHLKSTFYIDTDSISRDSIIYVDGKELSIGDFYDSLKVDPIVTPSGVMVKPVTDKISYGVDSNCDLVERNINYVMKHTVKKRMFSIRVGGKSVTVTEDHSMIVLRDGVLTEITPAHIIPTDVLITLNTTECISPLSTEMQPAH